MIKKLLKYLLIFKINFSASTAFAVDIIGGTPLIVVRLWMLSQLYSTLGGMSSNGQLIGLTVEQVLWTIMLVTAFTSTIWAQRFPEMIDEEVKSGNLAYSLVRPFSFVLYHYVGFLGRAVPLVVANVIVGTLAALFFVGSINITPQAFFGGLLLLFLAYSIEFLVQFCLGLCALWIEDTSGLIDVYLRLGLIIGGTYVPLSFFPETLRTVIEYLPMGHLLYQAARTFTHFETATFMHLLSIMGFWFVALLFLTTWIFRRGIRYVSVNGG